jgi:serine protease Do
MKYLLRCLVLASSLLCTATASSQPLSDTDALRNGPKVMQAFRAVVEKPRQHTVRVLVNGKEAAFGCIVEQGGWIVTKASELEGQVACRLADGKVMPAKIVGMHEPFDLALLKIEASGLPRVEWRDSKEIKVGQWVASVGTGAEPVGIGFVSVATRKFKPGDQPAKFFNPNGGWLGVTLDPASAGGTKIASVSPNSPALKASLKAKDIITEVAGRKIDNAQVLSSTLQRFKPGNLVTVKVKRGEEELELLAALSVMPPQSKGNPQETLGTTLSKRRGEFPVILQHDTGLRPEDCGGPLVDLDGKTVGINIARAGRTETYAVPAEEVQAVVEDLKAGKVPPPPVLAEVEKSPKDPQLVLRWASQLTPKDSPSKTQSGAFLKVQELHLAAGVTYAIELKRGAFDPYLRLEDAAGKKLAEDGDDNRDAMIVFGPPGEGTYRIVVSSLEAKEVGDFTLVVRKQPPTTKGKK